MFWKRKEKKIKEDELLILFGTRSGNSRLIAMQAEQFFRKNGIKTTCVNMSKYNPENLPGVKKLLAVVSTHGEGDPPEPARKFFHRIRENNIGSLSQLKYSVCALGDSAYEQFCKAGKELDEHLHRMGASAVTSRMDCDVNFSKDAATWIKESYRMFSNGNEYSHKTAETIHLEEKNNNLAQYRATVGLKKRLTEESSDFPVYHISLKVEDDNFNYEPGDSIEILPRNPEWLVKKIVDQILLHNVQHHPAAYDLKSHLQKKAEITRVNAGSIKRYNEFVNNNRLDQLINNKEALVQYIKQANLLDLLLDYPGNITAAQLISVPPKLTPRVYSIASGPAKNPTQVDLVVKTIRYQFRNLPHEGSGSVFITEDLQSGTMIDFILKKNPEFRLPNDPRVPVIMIGAGTGIAPFRSFLQERLAIGAKNRTWLIWGAKKQSCDSLYKIDLESFKTSQTLERLDTVFSRDNPDKKYVQDILIDNRTELLKWMERGAHIYVCGSIAMGKGVKSCLDRLLEKSPWKSVHNLQENNRYHSDVY